MTTITTQLRTVRAIRYVCPLREGGSLPAIVEGDDDGVYVLKFRGAGQGPKALIAELIGAEIARALGLLTPELIFVDLDSDLARSEPDSEIQALVKSSAGLNLALDYLPGSIGFDPLRDQKIEGDLASLVLWLDAFIMNVDRTPRNPNLLTWHKRLWLIDHGASLYFHHNWPNVLTTIPTNSGGSATPGQITPESPFTPIRNHVLLGRGAGKLEDADRIAHERLDRAVIDAIVGLAPDSWLVPEATFATPQETRAAYLRFLVNRLGRTSAFVEEALRARAQLV